MRQRWMVAVLLAIGLVAAACGDDSESGSTADDESTAAETTAPADETTESDDDGTETTEAEPEEQTDAASGGTMVVAISEDPGHFNPGITTGFNVHVVTGSVFNGLVELDDNANPLPDLAESWEVSDDATSYTFTLADGVTWHDGEPFTSADVKFTCEEVLLNFHSRTKSGLEGALASIDTPDDQTVVFTFSQPYAALLQRLNSTEAPILAQHIYGDVADVQEAEENLTPIGTGPFMFESHEIDNEVRLVRNPNYFKDGLPLLDEVVYRVIPDANTQLLALEQGEIDYLWRVPGAELERLGGDDAIDLYPVNSGPGGGFCVPTLTFNLDREIFDDIRVRQAIAHAIDRQQLVDQAIFGQGRAATGPISSEMAFAYTAEVTEYPRDIEGANALLDDAGFPAEGTRFTIDLLHFPNFSKYGEIIR
ncbi:MAG: ABC transporter substrate-binding protein, partial [Acidimicrobiales bacterium]